MGHSESTLVDFRRQEIRNLIADLKEARASLNEQDGRINEHWFFTSQYEDSIDILDRIQRQDELPVRDFMYAFDLVRVDVNYALRRTLDPSGDRLQTIREAKRRNPDYLLYPRRDVCPNSQ